MTQIKNLKLLIITLVVFYITACNHLFYYPDSNIAITPNKLELDYKEITIALNQDSRISGWLIQNKSNKKYGTVIHFHGNAENISTHFLYLSWIVNYGYDLFIFDYPGYGKSSGQAEKEQIFYSSRQVLRWVEKNIESKNLFLLGQSLGGAILIPAYAEAKIDNVRGIILDSTFSSYRYIAREKLASVWLTWPLQWPLGFLVSDSYSPINYIQNISVPILSFHSESDPVVSFASGNLLFTAANEPKQLYKLSKPGHCTAFIMHDDQYRKKLLEFFCNNLVDNKKYCQEDLKNLQLTKIQNSIEAFNASKNE